MSDTKLTLVSITFRGQRRAAFVQGHVQSNGKTTVSKDVMDELLSRTSFFGKEYTRGLTYSIG
ncbi:hypothetical protein [Neptuniibacter sp. QD37_11]|uniref:hypothetical protein n=1 Tax=Neptuniibacter sp. QD37_11 TaxID=3398209 RepID=UPI0039F51237